MGRLLTCLAVSTQGPHLELQRLSIYLPLYRYVFIVPRKAGKNLRVFHSLLSYINRPIAVSR